MLAEIKARAGADFPVTLSLSGYERYPGGRGVAAFARPGALESAAKALFAGRGDVLIATGFPVQRSDGAGREPETDGPQGAVLLARALRASGRHVALGSPVDTLGKFLGIFRVKRQGSSSHGCCTFGRPGWVHGLVIAQRKFIV